jgi:NAD(P)-dependent dehydrogenase (short-subunit alcohol dehydrogenase family)
LARDDRDRSHRDDAGHTNGPAVHARSQSGRDCDHRIERGPPGSALSADYVCSKWAILGFTQTLALEVASQNIRVNAVCPGPIEGDRIEDVMGRHAEIEGKSIAEVRREWEASPMNRFVEPQEVASVMLFLCSSEASAMTGQAINVTGGFIMT